MGNELTWISSDGHWIYKCKNQREYDNLAGIVGYFRDRVLIVLCGLRLQGFNPYVFEGRRTLARQAWLLAHHFSTILKSRHCVGKAVDIADAKLAWAASGAFWKALGEQVHRVEGLTWGGSWVHFRDVAHVEFS
jgi:hypothetical protein